MKKFLFLVCISSISAICFANELNPNELPVHNTLKPEIANKYDFSSEIKDGLAFVCSDDLCGYIDERGREVIKLQFPGAVCSHKQKDGSYWKNISCDSDSDFSEGFAAVVHKYVWYVSDNGKNYNVVFPKKYVPEYGKYVYGKVSGNNFIIVKNPGAKEKKTLKGHNLYGMPKYAYIDTTGKIVIKNDDFDYVGKFKNGKAKIGTKDGYGYIDTSGEIITEPSLIKRSKKSRTLNVKYDDYKFEYAKMKAHLDKLVAKTQSPSEYNEYIQLREEMLSSFVQARHGK